MIALVTSVLPVFIKKAKLDTFANEVVRYAEIEGRIGTQTRIIKQGDGGDASWACISR